MTSYTKIIMQFKAQFIMSIGSLYLTHLSAMLFYTSYVHSYVTISWRLPNGFDDLLVLPLVFLAFSIASMKNDVVKSSHFEFIKTLPRALKVSPPNFYLIQPILVQCGILIPFETTTVNLNILAPSTIIKGWTSGLHF